MRIVKVCTFSRTTSRHRCRSVHVIISHLLIPTESDRFVKEKVNFSFIPSSLSFMVNAQFLLGTLHKKTVSPVDHPLLQDIRLVGVVLEEQTKDQLP